MKERTLNELQKRIKELEEVISRRGVGSDYVQKAQRIQRDVNIGLVLGSAAIAGFAAWLLLSSDEE